MKMRITKVEHIMIFCDVERTKLGQIRVDCSQYAYLMNNPYGFLIQTGQAPLERGRRHRADCRKLVNPITKRDSIALGWKMVIFYKLSLLETPLRCLWHLISAHFLSFASIELPLPLLLLFLRRKQELVCEDRLQEMSEFKGNGWHITNQSFREESRAWICYTQAVLGE